MKILTSVAMFALASAMASMASAELPVPAKPGDTGQFVVNEKNMGGPRNGVRLQISVPPGILIVSTVNAGPIDIPSGKTGELNFSFAVSTSATSGIYKLAAKVVSREGAGEYWFSMDHPSEYFYSTLAVQADNSPSIVRPWFAKYRHPGAVKDFSAQRQPDDSFKLTFRASGSNDEFGQNDEFDLNILQNGHSYYSVSFPAAAPSEMQTYATGSLPVGIYQFRLSGRNYRGTKGPAVTRGAAVRGGGEFSAGALFPDGRREASLTATQEANVLPIIPQNSKYQPLQKSLRSSEKIEVTSAYQISSPFGAFEERPTLTFHFSPIYDEFGLRNLGVYAVSANGTLTRLEASIDRSSHTAIFPVDRSGGIYLMAYDAPGMNDVTPPKTTAHFSPAYTKTKFGILLTTATRISLSGEDYSTRTAVAAGYDQAFYRIDVPADAINNTIPNEYSSPFTLTLGTHTLTYFGRDKNGNYEAPTRLNLEVRDPRPGTK